MAAVAVVTGGARRIGSAIARHLHEGGFDIALHYRASADDARAMAAELNRRRPDSCQLFPADLDSADAVRELGQALTASYPDIALLVNNASGFEPTPVAGTTPEQFDRMLSANLRGPWLLIQALLPALRADGGNIVNIIDTHVQHPLPDFHAYGAAKAGLEYLTRSLAVALGPGIRVNGVAPGAILWPEDDVAYDEQTRLDTVANTPLGRLGEPLDIARTVAFLACDAPFITGQVIAVDGGRGLAP